VEQLAEVRARIDITVCANEGLWSEAEAYARISGRQADVYCFSPYWVGSIGGFHRLSWLAHYEVHSSASTRTASSVLRRRLPSTSC